MLFFALLISVFAEPHPCSVLKVIDSAWSEIWDFQKPGWYGATVATPNIPINKAPMNGNWSFKMDFCNKILAIDTQGNQIDYGQLTYFDFDEPARNLSKPLEFDQIFTGSTYSTTVNIYCGKDLNCTGLPGANKSACLSYPSTAAFCICSVSWGNQSVQNSLQINILSTSCPKGEPIPNPFPNNHTGLIVFLCLLFVFVSVFFGIAGYRYFVLGVHELDQLFPFCAVCCKKGPTAGTYTQVPSRGTYETL